MYVQLSTMDQLFGSPDLDYNVSNKFKEDVLGGSMENGIFPILIISIV